MNPLPHRHVQCEVCGTVVPAVDLPEHLLADAPMLKVIQTTHPEWGQKECEAHLRKHYGTDPRPMLGM